MPASVFPGSVTFSDHLALIYSRFSAAVTMSSLHQGEAKRWNMVLNINHTISESLSLGMFKCVDLIHVHRRPAAPMGTCHSQESDWGSDS